MEVQRGIMARELDKRKEGGQHAKQDKKLKILCILKNTMNTKKIVHRIT